MLNEMLILRLALLGASFAGLCMLARRALKLDPLAAPGFVCCGIITLLTLAGMAGILFPALLALYIVGFAALAVCLFQTKGRFHGGLALSLAALTALLLWRFQGNYCYVWDDFSHWMLAARFPLERDALPTGASSLITFQSYPPGTAMFIYYFCRALGIGDELFLTAQNLLMIMTLLPMLTYIDEKKRRLMMIPACALTLILFKFDRPLCTLMVDWTLCCVGFGAIASILHPSNSSTSRALIVAIPYMAALVFIKSSGMFFAVWAAAALGWTAAKRSRKAAVRAVLAAVGTALACFLLWTLYVKVSYSAGLSTQHAVSLTAYAAKAQKKGLREILRIGWYMLGRLVHPDTTQIFGILFALLCGGVALSIPQERRALLKKLGLCALVYASWFAMLFFMYVFSMPLASARRLAAFARYNSTGMLFAMMLAALAVIHHIGRAPSPRAAAARLAAMAAACLAAAPLLNYHLGELQYDGFYQDLIAHNDTPPALREFCAEIKREHNLPDEGRYQIWTGEETRYGYSFLYARYELQSGNLRVMFRHDDELYDVRLGEATPVSNSADALDPDADAILVYAKDEALEAALDEFLETHDVPVYYANDGGQEK